MREQIRQRLNQRHEESRSREPKYENSSRSTRPTYTRATTATAPKYGADYERKEYILREPKRGERVSIEVPEGWKVIVVY